MRGGPEMHKISRLSLNFTPVSSNKLHEMRKINSRLPREGQNRFHGCEADFTPPAVKKSKFQ